MVQRFRRGVLVAIASSLVIAGGVARAADKGKTEPPAPVIAVDDLVTTLRYEKDGSFTTRQKGRLRALTVAGRNALVQVARAVDTSSATVTFDKVVTIKKDGRRIAADPASATEVDSPYTVFGTTYSDVKLRVIQAADLDVGDTLEFEISETGKPPIPGEITGSWQSDWRGREGRETVVLDLPADRAVTVASPATVRGVIEPASEETKEGRVVRRWTVAAPPADKRESPSHALPVVFVMSSLTDWKAVGDWYLGLEQDTLESTPELRELVQRLTEGKATAREKLEAIFAHVSANVRYVGIQIGIHGFKPHRAADIARNGYGDCKDKHVLMKTLLAAAGIPARAALVASDGRIASRDVPSPLQFDHMVTVVRLDGADVWFDASMPGAAFGQLGVYGGDALVVEAGASRLVRAPESPLEPQTVHVSSIGNVDAAGTLTLETSIRLRHLMEPGLRTMFREGDPQWVKKVFTLAGWAQIAAEPEVSGIGSSDPTDTRQPFEYHYTLRRVGFANLLEKSAALRVPGLVDGFALEGMAWRDDAAEDPDPDEPRPAGQKRTLFPFPVTYEESIALTFPPGTKLEPPLRVRMARPEGEYASEYTLDRNTIKVRRTLIVRSPKVAADGVAGFEALRRLAEKDARQELRISGGALQEDALAALSADELNSAGANALDADKPEAALALLLAATKKDATHKYAWNNLGRVYLRLDKPQDAEAALRRQLEINAFDEYAWSNLGSALLKQGRHAEAEAAYRKHLEIEPLDGFAYRGLASALKAQKRDQEAIVALEQALQANREDPATMIQLGTALLETGRAEEGRALLEKARHLPGGPAGLALSATGIALAPAVNTMAEAPADLAATRREAAQATVKELTKKLADLKLDEFFNGIGDLVRLAGLLDELGQLALKSGDRPGARAYFKAAVDISLGPQIAGHLALLEAQDGRPEQALDFYALASQGGEVDVEIGGALQKLAKQRYASAAARQQDLKARAIKVVMTRRVKPDQLGLPKTLSAGQTPMVIVRVLVDETGRALEAKAVFGNDAARQQAEADALKIRYPVVKWPGGALRAARTVFFSYALESGFRDAYWGFGPDPVGEFAGGLRTGARLPL